METKKQSATKKKAVAKKAVAKKIVKKTGPIKKTKVALAVKKPAVKIKTAKKPARKIVKKSASMAAEKKVKTAKIITGKKEPFIKKIAYYALSIILGTLLSVFVGQFMELIYVKKSMEAGLTLDAHKFLGTYTFLPVYAQSAFLLAGIMFGFWLGSWGWQIVYVERRHRMFRKA